MNILREMRKFKQRSLKARVILLFLFALMLIINTYAWFVTTKEADVTGIKGEVKPWDVEFYIKGEEVKNSYTFTIDKLYPGMQEFNENIYIRNAEERKSSLSYKIISVKLFGEEIIESLKQENEITEQNNTIKVFSNKTKYPFTVVCTYDKKQLIGKYESDEKTPDSVANLNLKINWDYDNKTDELDTNIGKDSYQYYQNYQANENEIISALQIIVEIEANAS